MKYKNCTDEQIKFFEMIENYQNIMQFWNINKREVNIENLKDFYNYTSDDIKALISFFMTIWLGNDEHYFRVEFTKLIKNINQFDKEIIINWMKDPFFA